MHIFKTIAEYQSWRLSSEIQESLGEGKLNSEGASLGFVPTMGSLHAGHHSLIEKCVAEHSVSVVSIFVNPLQFNDQSDYNTYPVDIDSDLKACNDLGVTAVFLPEKNEVYHEKHGTYCQVPALENTLCGVSRPGHFKGVCTVVLKLINIIRPSVMYLGQKDFQQATIIKQMVRDLNLGVQVSLEPIIREPSGLAMSSRNQRLSEDKRTRAASIQKGLEAAKQKFDQGEMNVTSLIKTVHLVIMESAPEKIDYISVVRQSDLQEVAFIDEPCVLAVAVYYSKVRLIDNVLLEKP